MLTDSHCHLTSQKFSDTTPAELVQRATESGVTRIITLGTDLVDGPQNIALAQQFQNVYACVGIHPCDVHETPDDFLSSLREMAKAPEVAAIGETGLDYFHPAPDGLTEADYRQRQRSFLTQHFHLAKELGLNIVIHTRDREGIDSFNDALDIYKDFHTSVRAVFHCFIGNLEQAEKVIDLGGLISFTGIATFKKPGYTLDVARALPAGTFMLETDAPFLAPMPHRGKRNEPSYTRLTAEVIADARNESLTQLATHTEKAVENFYRFGK